MDDNYETQGRVSYLRRTMLVENKWKQTEGGSQKGQPGQVPPNCDMCGVVLMQVAYDANIKYRDQQGRMRRTWAWCCPQCYGSLGMGLGIGRGQKYERVEVE
jgi:hypothetical protein